MEQQRCHHPTRHIRETFVLYSGKPNRSSVEWICKDCGARGITSTHYAFYHESCKREVGPVKESVDWSEYVASWARPSLRASF